MAAEIDKIETYKNLKKELETITKSHFEYLSSYFVHDGFTRPLSDENTKLVSTTLSTSFVAISLFEDKKLKDKAIQYFKDKKLCDNIFQICQNKLKQNWYSKEKDEKVKQEEGESFHEYDIYRTPLILKAAKILEIDYSQNEVKKSIEEICKNILKYPAAQYDDDFPPSGFLTYCAMESLILWCEDTTKHEQTFKKSDGTDVDIHYVLTKIFKWAKEQLYKQISFYRVEEYDRTDPIRCIFTLAIYKKYYEYLKQFKIKETVNKFNQKFVDVVVEYVFKDQEKNGLWKKYLPILALPTTGNVYPFALYSLKTLLSIAEPSGNLFPTYKENIDKALEWIKNNEKELNVKNGSDDKPVRGWRSNHSIRPQGNPESWSTSLTFDFVRKMEEISDENLSDEIVLKLDGLKKEKTGVGLFEPNFYDSNVEYHHHNTTDVLSLRKILFQLLIEPRMSLQKINSKKANSAIFFGPPGTSKTQISKVIAECLGWSFVKISADMFLLEGRDKVALGINKVFDYLKYLKNTVILFDEIDEYIKDRGNPENKLEDKLLTSTFLAKLNELKDNKDVIFIFATNLLHEADPAITRMGRFDCKIQINSPNHKSLKDIAEKIIKSRKDIEETISKFIKIDPTKPNPNIISTLTEVIHVFIDNKDEIISTSTKGIKDASIKLNETTRKHQVDKINADKKIIKENIVHFTFLEWKDFINGYCEEVSFEIENDERSEGGRFLPYEEFSTICKSIMESHFKNYLSYITYDKYIQSITNPKFEEIGKVTLPREFIDIPKLCIDCIYPDIERYMKEVTS